MKVVAFQRFFVFIFISPEVKHGRDYCFAMISYNHKSTYKSHFALQKAFCFSFCFWEQSLQKRLAALISTNHKSKCKTPFAKQMVFFVFIFISLETKVSAHEYKNKKSRLAAGLLHLLVDPERFELSSK